MTASKQFNAVSFYNANKGIAVSGAANSDGGNPGGYTYGAIIHTTDGGNSWYYQYYQGEYSFNGTAFLNENTYIAVGVSGDKAGYAITRNGGISWNSMYFTSITDPLTGASFVNSSVGTIVGHNGRILRTIDGASNWYTQSAGITKNLHGVCFTDANNGTVVGDDGIILHTSDGGAKWRAQSSGTNEDLYGVHFIDSNLGKIVGSNATILHTTDGGITWTIQTACTDNDLFAVSFTDENIGSTVGDNGTILRTTNGGITSVFDEKGIEPLKKYILSQNYPNPFNPGTIINYKVGSKQFVSLKVYDLLGKELATLVNSEQSAGNYAVEFNGSNLSTGVYFYRLQIGNFIDTKKMILAK